MNVSSENRVVQRYNEACRSGGDFAGAYRRVELLPSYARHPNQLSLTRPVFVPEQEIRGFAEDMIGLLGILTSLTRRMFDGDLHRFFDALGLDHGLGALMTRLGGGAPQIVGRADVFRDRTGFKLLEFGIGSELGGWRMGGGIPRAMLEDERFAAFAAEQGLGYVDSMQELVTALRQASAAAGLGEEPLVAIVEAPGALAKWGNGWVLQQESFAEYGMRSLVCEITDLTEDCGRVVAGSTPVDIVYRSFEAADLWGDDEVIARADLLCRAHEEGRVLMWTPMEANLYGEKGCMALLSDPRWNGVLTADERALVDRVLPWTRSINRDVPQLEALIEECRDRRPGLILKPNSMYGGIGVVGGWECDSAQWGEALERGMAEGAIVQERIEPAPETVVNPATGADEEWRTLWGVFYTPNGYAGANDWRIPAAGSTVLGLATKKELAAGVFHFVGGERPESAEIFDHQPTHSG